MADIRKRGRVWQARVRRKGHPTFTSTHDTRAQAEAWAESVERDLHGGLAPVAVAAASFTLGDALKRYRDEITPKKKGAQVEGYRVKRLLSHPLAQRALSSVRGLDLAAYRDARLKEVRPASVRLELALISNVYTICAKRWGLEGLANPVAAMQLPKPARGRERRLRPGEEERLLAAADPRLRPLITWALETAMRRGEICSLRKQDVDAEAKVATLRDTKNGETRTVPLSSRALAVWPGDGFKLPPTTVSHLFADACRAAGVDDLRFHDLRHEATSRLFETCQFNIVEISMITGHKDLAMLRRYTHLSARSLAERLG